MSLFNKKEKDYDEIINEIIGNLTKDKQKNIEYLTKQAKIYKNHSMSYEIIKEIGRQITNNLKENELQEINNVIHKNIISHLENGIELMQNRKFSDAEKELNEFVSITKYMFKNDKIYKYFAPANAIQYMLILNDENGKEFKETGIDFSIGYTYLGIIAVEQHNINKAREALKQALQWNPYNMSAMFEDIEIYKIEGKLEDYRNKTVESINKIYNPIDLARFYRNLGYYYIENKQWDLAKAIYCYSIRISNNDKAQNELIYIMQKTNDKTLPELKDIKNILEKYSIPSNISDRILKILMQMYNQMKNDNNEDSDLGKYISSLIKLYSEL